MKNISDIKKILISNDYRDNEIVSNILSKYKIETGDIHIFSDEIELNEIIDKLKINYQSKEVLILKDFPGRKFQKCPGSSDMICCNYYLLNTCFDCLYNCTYCFLNSYLNSFGITQFTNLEELIPSIREFSKTYEKILRVGTGEFTDSLMFDDMTGIAKKLISGTADLDNVFLEFKTKSDNIGHLLNLRNKGNTVLAWTLNTDYNIKKYEEGTSTLHKRIEAAKKAQDSGYFTAFHFDPIIKYSGFLEDYLGVIDMLFDKLNPEKIVWISMGCFRYSQGFKDIIKYKFFDETITKDEMFVSLDGKYKYIKSERVEIFSSLKSRINQYSRTPYIYLCMEDSDVWNEVFGLSFNNSDELEAHMSQYIKSTFISR